MQEKNQAPKVKIIVSGKQSLFAEAYASAVFESTACWNYKMIGFNKQKPALAMLRDYLKQYSFDQGAVFKFLHISQRNLFSLRSEVNDCLRNYMLERIVFFSKTEKNIASILGNFKTLDIQANAYVPNSTRKRKKERHLLFDGKQKKVWEVIGDVRFNESKLPVITTTNELELMLQRTYTQFISFYPENYIWQISHDGSEPVIDFIMARNCLLLFSHQFISWIEQKQLAVWNEMENQKRYTLWQKYFEIFWTVSKKEWYFKHIKKWKDEIKQNVFVFSNVIMCFCVNDITIEKNDLKATIEGFIKKQCWSHDCETVAVLIICTRLNDDNTEWTIKETQNKWKNEIKII